MATSKIEQVVLHFANCRGTCKKYPRGECDKYFSILGLIKALRKESERDGYMFKAIRKTDMPYTILLTNENKSKPKITKLNLARVLVEDDKITKIAKRLDAYLTIKYENGGTRIILFNEIKVR